MKTLVFSLLCLFTSGDALASSLRPLITERVVSLTSLMSDGIASLHEESLVFVESSLTEYGETHKVVSVIFNISDWGGGNGSRQYLAIFKHNDEASTFEPYKANTLQLLSVVKVGARSERWFNAIEQKQMHIYLRGLAWQDDALCCPSQPIEVVYVYENHGFTEQNSANK